MQTYIARAVHATIEGALDVVALILLTPIAALLLIGRAWRWLSLQAVYGGDAEARDRAEYKGR